MIVRIKPTRLPLVLALLAAGCTSDKDPLTSDSAPSTASQSGSATDGDTDPVTTSDSDGTDGSNSNSGTSDPTTATTSPTSPTGPGTATDPTVTSTSGPETASDPGSGPTSDPSTDPSDSESATVTTADPTGTDPDEEATQLCYDTINMYRASIGLAPYDRWHDAEDCSDGEAQSDGQSGTPHGAFGQCGESAQNECPGWPGPPAQMITGCLEQMWAEGPGDDFSMHGHYINMSSTSYTKVACGFAEVNGEIWAVQNFQ